MRQNQGVQWWLFVSAGLMLIGGFGPWVSVMMISANGTDGDGWFVIVAAVAGAGLYYARRTSKRAGAWAIAGGVLGLAVTAYDRSNLEHAINHGGVFGQSLLHVGWGLNLALLASLSLAIAGVAAILKAEPEAAPGVESPA